MKIERLPLVAGLTCALFSVGGAATFAQRAPKPSASKPATRKAVKAVKKDAKTAPAPPSRSTTPNAKVTPTKPSTVPEGFFAMAPGAGIGKVSPGPNSGATSGITAGHSDATLNPNAVFTAVPGNGERVPVTRPGETKSKASFHIGKVSFVRAEMTRERSIDLPDNLRQTKLDVTIEAKITVLASGEHRAEIVKGSGYPELDKAVLTALNGAAFKPASLDGKKIDSVLPISIPILLE